MDQTDYTQSFLILGVILAFFFAPVIVAFSKSPFVLRFVTILLCLFAFVGGILVIMSSNFIGMAMVPVVFGTVWIGAMICGAAAFVADIAQRQSNDATYRLLLNEPDRLSVPNALKNRRPKNDLRENR